MTQGHSPLDFEVLLDLVRRGDPQAAAASLDHPHIVPVLEVGRHADRPYFVMKLIRGGSLTGRLQELTGRPRRCAELLLPIARAVQHMHLPKMLHRNLKRSNMLIERSGQPQVTDFGLARADRGTSELSRLNGTQQIPPQRRSTTQCGRQAVQPVSA